MKAPRIKIPYEDLKKAEKISAEWNHAVFLYTLPDENGLHTKAEDVIIQPWSN